MNNTFFVKFWHFGSAPGTPTRAPDHWHLITARAVRSEEEQVTEITLNKMYIFPSREHHLAFDDVWDQIVGQLSAVDLI